MNGAFQGFEITELTNHNHNVDHLVSSRLTGKPQNKHALGQLTAACRTTQSAHWWPVECFHAPFNLCILD